MKSIQTKILTLTLGCVLLSTLAVGMICFINVDRVLKEDANTILNLLCEERAMSIDERLLDIEQSVKTVYNFAISQLKDTDRLLENEEYKQAYIGKVREVIINAAENTDGAVAAYFRFNPEIGDSMDGIFMKKDREDFVDQQITDILKYEKDDVEHVGWYYITVENGCETWIAPYYNRNIGVEMISFVIPVYVQDVLIGVIGMDIDVQTLYDSVSPITVYDTGYAFLFDAGGDIIYHKDYPKGVKKEEFEGDLEGMEDLLLASRQIKGLYDYEWKDIKKYMVSKVLVNDMALGICVPAVEINRPEYEMIGTCLLFLLVILSGCIVLTIHSTTVLIRPLKQLTAASQKIAMGDLQVSIECHTKDEVGVLAQSFQRTADNLKRYIDDMNRLAYMDVLTGVKNKASYEECVSTIDRKIKDGTAAFAVVMMDINDLKLMNDTYGHEMGDMLITDAAGIMRDIFGSDNVYRIGGDEFAAILTETELLCYKERTAAFNQSIERFNRTKHGYESDLQVACGAAVYIDETDETYADVFRRADEQMYRDKEWKKGQGKR